MADFPKTPGSASLTAFVAYMADIPQVIRDAMADVVSAKGARFQYSYATLAAIFAVLIPILARHGFALLQSTYVEAGFIWLRTTLVHAASEEGITSVVALCEVGTPPQIYGSHLSYHKRYAVITLALVAPDDGSDDDGQSASAAPVKRPPRGAGKAAQGDGKTPLPESAVSTQTSDRERIEASVSKVRGLGQLTKLIENPEFAAALDRLDHIEKPLAERLIADKRAQLESHQLSSRAAMAMKAPAFWLWVKETHGIDLTSAIEAERWQFDRWGIASKAALDSDPIAGPVARTDLDAYQAWFDAGRHGH